MGIDSFILDQFEKGGPLMWPLALPAGRVMRRRELYTHALGHPLVEEDHGP